MRILGLFFVLCIATKSCYGQKKGVRRDSASQKTPTEIVRGIFGEFIKYEDGLDSDEHKKTMDSCLKHFLTHNENIDFTLLIDIWLYYDPTDFPTRDLVNLIFKKNKTLAYTTIEKRIQNPRKFETRESLFELIWLKDDLK